MDCLQCSLSIPYLEIHNVPHHTTDGKFHATKLGFVNSITENAVWEELQVERGRRSAEGTYEMEWSLFSASAPPQGSSPCLCVNSPGLEQTEIGATSGLRDANPGQVSSQ